MNQDSNVLVAKIYTTIQKLFECCHTYDYVLKVTRIFSLFLLNKTQSLVISGLFKLLCLH